MRVFIAIAAAVFALVASQAAASSSSATALRQQERRLVRQIEQAKTTLRWFEKRSVPGKYQFLYSKDPKVRRKAWHAVALARQTIIKGQIRLRRIRDRLSAFTAIPHLKEWRCIHRFEAGWRGTDNATHDTYFGGLQFDRGFMRDYGGDMLRKYGGRYANYWSPRDQMIVAERAWRDRGFSPWPTTAHQCGLL